MSLKTTREEVLEVLQHGRATPRLIRERTSIDSKQNAQYHLNKLRAEDKAEKVTRGLYVLVEDVDENYQPPHTTLNGGELEFGDDIEEVGENE